jgi:hypothetical protein
VGFVVARIRNASISESRRLAPTAEVDCIVAVSSETYGVVGVRADGSRNVLSLKLSLEDARYVQRVLLKAEIFRDVLIQRCAPIPGAEDETRLVSDRADRSD